MAVRITTTSPDEDTWTISVVERPERHVEQINLILPDGTFGDWFRGRESWAAFLTRHGHPPDAYPPPLTDPLEDDPS